MSTLKDHGHLDTIGPLMGIQRSAGQCSPRSLISSIEIDSHCYLEWSCPSAFGQASSSQSISSVVSLITGTILSVGIVAEVAGLS